jgi:hypothetical protein
LSGTTSNRKWYRSGATLERGVSWIKRSFSLNFRYPSAELRDQVRTAVKERGFRSVQVFLIATCELAIQSDANTLSDSALSIPGNCDIIKAAMLSEKPLSTASVKRHSLDTINVENDAELDALTAQVLAAGNKIAESERAEMIRKGIIDEHGNLLKTELPEDMRKDADRDFGG